MLEVPVARFNKILQRLSDPEMIDLSRFDLIVHGGSGQSKQFYRHQQSDQDAEVLWTGWSAPRWTIFLEPFIPGQAGLIRLKHPQKLRPLFEELSATGMASVYYVLQHVTPLLVEKISGRKFRDVQTILENESEYAYLKAEQDDIVQQGFDCYYLHDYSVGGETAAVIRTVFSGLE
jgi:hypothetical protein